MNKSKCFHCGCKCKKNKVSLNDRLFCSNECKSVYEILSKSNLISYYGLKEFPGFIPKEINSKYNYLENEKDIAEMYDFIDNEIKIVTFEILQIHARSCVWLLENIKQLTNSIITSEVNLIKKEVRIVFDNTKISFRQLVELLASIGYEPRINLKKSRAKKNILSRIFCVN